MALINLRDALMAGKRLPYDAEVEYLESTGTQYINTGAILDSTYGIDMTFAPMEDWHVSEHGIFGASNSSRHNVLQIQTSAAGVGLWMPASTRIAAKEYSTTGILQHWQINIGNDGKVFIDGTTKGSTRPNSSSDLNQPIYLFARNLNGSLKSGSCSSMRLYSCKITDANGNAVFDPIPVRKGTVGYLYDRVSGKLFGNAGTGDFVLGPDVVPVEYIESHGTEWIATGIEAGRTSSSIKITATLKFTELSTGEHDLAGSGNAATPTMGRNGSNYFMWAKGGTTWYPTGCDTNWHTVSYTFNNPSGRVFELDGTLYSGTQDNIFATGEGIHIFASGPNRYPLNCQLTKLEIWQNGILVRSFLTVRVGTDATSWEGAMMDVLTRRIYRNAGTGAFGYGNDLPYPIPA